MEGHLCIVISTMTMLETRIFRMVPTMKTEDDVEYNENTSYMHLKILNLHHTLGQASDHEHKIPSMQISTRPARDQ